MLTTYRRHRKNCEHRGEGRKYRRCRCPIWVDGFLNGEEIRESLGHADWQKAQDTVREWEADGQRKSELQEPGPITVREAWEKFIADAEARNLSASTVRKYKLLSRTMQEFATRRGIRFLVEIELPVLRDFRAAWNDGPLSSTKKLERLRSFYRFTQENKWVETALASKLKSPKFRQRPTMPFSHDEMVRILAACNSYTEQAGSRAKNSAHRLRALVLVLRYTGMRIGDAVKLSLDQINGSKIFLYTQKSGVPVYTVVPDFVIQALDTIPRVASRNLFWSGAGTLDGVVSSWRKRLTELFTLAKVADGHAHRFRDTFATELLLGGVPTERVAILLGHQSIKVTEKYYSAWTDSRQRQVEADLQQAWQRDPIVLLQAKGTREVHQKREAVN